MGNIGHGLLHTCCFRLEFPPVLGPASATAFYPLSASDAVVSSPPLRSTWTGRAPWPPAVQILNTWWSPNLCCFHLVAAREALLSRGRPRSRPLHLPQMPGAPRGRAARSLRWPLMRAMMVMLTVTVTAAGLAARETRGSLGCAVTLLPWNRGVPF